jgi:hypothetical protein
MDGAWDCLACFGFGKLGGGNSSKTGQGEKEIFDALELRFFF